MPAYLIADVTVTNEEQMKVYREWSTRAMQEHGAEVLARGGRTEQLEGGWAPQRIVVLKFKDLAAARAYYDSETYTRAREAREGAGSIRMIGYEGGSDASAQQAYEAGRRAVIRCGQNGFPLPPEKYDQWKELELVFDPNGMRMR